jgi:hypothetical protein
MLDDFMYSGYSILLQLIGHLQKENVDICSHHVPLAIPFIHLMKKACEMKFGLAPNPSH